MILLIFCNWPAVIAAVVALFAGSFIGFAAAALCVAGTDAHLEEGQEASRE